MCVLRKKIASPPPSTEIQTNKRNHEINVFLSQSRLDEEGIRF